MAQLPHRCRNDQTTLYTGDSDGITFEQFHFQVRNHLLQPDFIRLRQAGSLQDYITAEVDNGTSQADATAKGGLLNAQMHGHVVRLLSGNALDIARYTKPQDDYFALIQALRDQAVSSKPTAIALEDEVFASMQWLPGSTPLAHLNRIQLHLSRFSDLYQAEYDASIKSNRARHIFEAGLPTNFRDTYMQRYRRLQQPITTIPGLIQKLKEDLTIDDRLHTPVTLEQTTSPSAFVSSPHHSGTDQKPATGKDTQAYNTDCHHCVSLHGRLVKARRRVPPQDPSLVCERCDRQGHSANHCLALVPSSQHHNYDEWQRQQQQRQHAAQVQLAMAASQPPPDFDLLQLQDQLNASYAFATLPTLNSEQPPVVLSVFEAIEKCRASRPLMPSTTDGDLPCVFDTACTGFAIFPSADLLTCSRPLTLSDSSLTIEVANGSFSRPTHIGSATLRTKTDDGREHHLHFPNALVAPDSPFPLLSSEQLIRPNGKVTGYEFHDGIDGTFITTPHHERIPVWHARGLPWISVVPIRPSPPTPPSMTSLPSTLLSDSIITSEPERTITCARGTTSAAAVEVAPTSHDPDSQSASNSVDDSTATPPWAQGNVDIQLAKPDPAFPGTSSPAIPDTTAAETSAFTRTQAL